LKNLRKFLSLFSFGLLAVILLLQANNTLFHHTHQIAEGKFIAHAHPYSSEDPPTEHNHSEKELLYLDQIAHGVYLDAPQILVPITYAIVFPQRRLTLVERVFTTNTLITLKTRGPPFLFA
jgi:hypothetical protein